MKWIWIHILLGYIYHWLLFIILLKLNCKSWTQCENTMLYFLIKYCVVKIFLFILWDCPVTPISIKPSLSTNHHTKMEIPDDLMQSIYSKLCEKTTSWTNPCLDILEYGIRTICNYFLMRHWSGGSRKGKYVHSLISNQNLILVTFTYVFFYCRLSPSSFMAQWWKYVL